MNRYLARLGVRLFIFAAGFCPTWQANATFEEAERLFVEGDFRAAADAAAELDTADGLALAARATLAYMDFKAAPDERSQAAALAEHFAREALAKDANHVEALLHLSIAIGHKARERGAVVAHFQGLAREGRSYLDQAIALDPDNSWSNGTLGAWHMEIVRHAGNGLAGLFYDANAEEGIALFERAFTLDPDNLLLNEEFAVALLALDAKIYAERAAGHLRKALRLTPRHRLEELAQARASAALAAVESGDQQQVARLIEAIRGKLKSANGIRRDPGFTD